MVTIHCCFSSPDQVFELTACSRAHLEKLIVTQLVMKFPVFYGTQKFITMFTRAHHWSLSRGI